MTWAECQTHHHQIYGVCAGIDQKIHVRRTVVDGVEAPQPRHGMAEAVAPVRADIGHDQADQHACPQRHTLHCANGQTFSNGIGDIGFSFSNALVDETRN